MIARAMNADDAAELLRRLQALEMELNRRPTVEAVQAEIARQLNSHAGNLEAIRLAIERLGAADGHRPTAGQHIKPKDLMPKDWAGDVGDAQGFSEFAFKLLGWMRSAYENGGQMLMAVDAMDTYDYDSIETAATSVQEADRAKRDLYAIMSRTMGGKAHVIVKNTVSGDGFEAWHKVLRE